MEGLINRLMKSMNLGEIEYKAELTTRRRRRMIIVIKNNLCVIVRKGIPKK